MTNEGGPSDDGRTWVALEKVTQQRMEELETEVAFLREMLRSALASIPKETHERSD